MARPFHQEKNAEWDNSKHKIIANKFDGTVRISDSVEGKILYKVEDNGLLLLNANLAQEWKIPVETFSNLTEKLKEALRCPPSSSPNSHSASGLAPA